jgi:hypothetical protein
LSFAPSVGVALNRHLQSKWDAYSSQTSTVKQLARYFRNFVKKSTKREPGSLTAIGRDITLTHLTAGKKANPSGRLGLYPTCSDRFVGTQPLP